MTISAPVLVEDMASIASTNSPTMCFASSLFTSPNTLEILLRPKYSSPLRSSGWKMTTMATSPTVISPDSSQCSVYRCSTSDSIVITTKTNRPLASCSALVSRMKPSTL